VPLTLAHRIDLDRRTGVQLAVVDAVVVAADAPVVAAGCLVPVVLMLSLLVQLLHYSAQPLAERRRVESVRPWHQRD